MIKRTILLLLLLLLSIQQQQHHVVLATSTDDNETMKIRNNNNNNNNNINNNKQSRDLRFGVFPLQIEDTNGDDTTDSDNTSPTPVPAPSPSLATSTSTSNTGNTFVPTITWSPTSSTFPTITALPTYTSCNICISGNINNPNDVITLPTTDINCIDAEMAGQQGLLDERNCNFLQTYLSDPANNNVCDCQRDPNATIEPTPQPIIEYPDCNICGDGDGDSDTNLDIVNPAGTIPSPNANVSETLLCSFVQEGGANGLWSPELCTYFQSVVDTSCGGCTIIDDDNDTTNNSTNSSTTSPGVAPPGTDPELSTCPICIDPFLVVGNPDAVIDLGDSFGDDILDALPGTGGVDFELTCSLLQTSGQFQLWDSLVCAFLQQQASTVCDCQVPPTSAPVTQTPTITPVEDGTTPTITPGGTTSAPTITPQQGSTTTAPTSFNGQDPRSTAATTLTARESSVVIFSMVLLVLLL